MLHAPLIAITAKLDISRLLESTSSPTRQQQPAEPERPHIPRSTSDPPAATPYLPASQRSSFSSTQSIASSYVALSAPALPQAPSQPFPRSQGNHRPRIPSISAIPLFSSAFSPLQIEQSGQASGSLAAQYELGPTSHHAHSLKRSAPMEAHPSASPAKRQSKWTPDEDALVIELRGAGMKWEDISRRIPGRTPLSCRLHYQNYIERRSQWDEDRKNRLARLYERLKPEMWKPLAAELNVPWRAAEAVHWQLGQAEMARRAGVTPFSLSAAGGPRPGSSDADISTTTALPGENPHPGAYIVPVSGLSGRRRSYFEERESSHVAQSYGRARSISASSYERRGYNPSGLRAIGSPLDMVSGERRQVQEPRSLPSLAEMGGESASYGEGRGGFTGHAGHARSASHGQ